MSNQKSVFFHYCVCSYICFPNQEKQSIIPISDYNLHQLTCLLPLFQLYGHFCKG